MSRNGYGFGGTGGRGKPDWLFWLLAGSIVVLGLWFGIWREGKIWGWW